MNRSSNNLTPMVYTGIAYLCSNHPTPARWVGGGGRGGANPINKRWRKHLNECGSMAHRQRWARWMEASVRGASVDVTELSVGKRPPIWLVPPILLPSHSGRNWPPRRAGRRFIEPAAKTALIIKYNLPKYSCNKIGSRPFPQLQQVAFSSTGCSLGWWFI